MTITRTRIRCRERACPWPFDEEMHEVPWCRGIKGHECFGGVTHQHHPKRSQGGKEIVALLCAGAHDIIDNGTKFGNVVIERGGRRIYQILHEKRGVLYERDIGQEGRNDGSVGDSADSHEPNDADSPVAGALAVLVGASTGSGEELVMAQRDAPDTLPEPAGASGVPSAAAEVPDSGSGADALAVAPGASGVPSDGDGSGEGDTGATIRLGQLVTDAGSPPSSGASRPEERVGRDSEAGAQPAALSGETPSENLAVTPPDSLDYVHTELIYQALDNGIEIAPEITFEHWAVMARKMIAESKGRQWKAGDTLNAGERFGERCWQYLDEFDYPIETLANYGRVAAAYKLAERRPLSFGHHQACYRHPQRLSLLDMAVLNNMTVKELRQVAYPDTRIRIQRFTIEELRGLFQDWLKAEQRNRYNVGDFLDWLGKEHTKA